MTPDVIAAIIASGIGFLTLVGSFLLTSFTSGTRWGRAEMRISMLESNQDKLATKEQVSALKEDIAEIKGMFRMTLRRDDAI